MRRRRLVAAIGAALATAPLAALAQTSARPALIGYLAPGGGSPIPARVAAFFQTMQQLGWQEGDNVTYQRRFAQGRFDRLPELAAELVALSPDVIVTGSSPPALAAKKATATIPIVALDPGDPVATGLVASLAHPGGNITGISSMAPDLAAKRLAFLKEMAPAAGTAAILFNAAIPVPEIALKAMAEPAARLGCEVRPTAITGPDGLGEALARLVEDKTDSFVVFPDPLTFSLQQRLVQFAAERGLPALYGAREFVDGGGLVCYGPNYADMFRRGAYLVDRILRGAKPYQLPVEQPAKFELVINLKTAAALGLTIPQTLLARADEVIE